MGQRGKKIAVMTDVHGNLPALEAALKTMKAEACDYIFHTGDVLAIGPYSRECLELLLSDETLKMIMGNHDQWFAHGLPDPIPKWMTDGEIEHQLWVHSCMDESLKNKIKSFPYVIEKSFFDFKVTFVHYGFIGDKKEFGLSIPNPTVDLLDEMFQGFSSDIIFYGHNHHPSDIKGTARYINPGSLGCNKDPVARFVILECSQDEYKIEHFHVPYDKEKVFNEFERKKVPQKEFIMKNFYGKE